MRIRRRGREVAMVDIIVIGARCVARVGVMQLGAMRFGAAHCGLVSSRVALQLVVSIEGTSYCCYALGVESDGRTRYRAVE